MQQRYPMHELSIAQSIGESVRGELARHGGGRVTRIGLKIGEVSGVNTEALRFCFEISVKDTDLGDAVLDIEAVPLTYRCNQCNHDFVVADFQIACPLCGSVETRAVAGDELQITYLEVE